MKRAKDDTWRARIRFGQDRQFRAVLPATLTPAQADRRLERLKEVAGLVGNLPDGEARLILRHAQDAKTVSAARTPFFHRAGEVGRVLA